MTYGTINADVISTSTSGGVLGAGNASIMKNRIINGAMVIDQRNAGASVTLTNTSSNTYLVDRFNGYCTVASKFSAQQNAGSVTPPTGFTNYLGATSLSAYSVAASDQFYLAQFIEGFNTADLGWGSASAKTVTLSFQVYSSLTGTFGGSLVNDGYNRSYPFTYSIPVANTWTTVSVTIAGDTTGTWAKTTSTGIRVFFGLGVGSTYSGTAGSWAGSAYLSATGATSVVGTSGATLYITGVQLEVGSSATGFEYRQYQQELALCQRYAYVFRASGTNNRIAVSGNSSGTGTYPTIFLKQTMRTTPSLTISAATDFQIENYSSSKQTCSAVSLDNSAVDACVFSATTASSTGGGNLTAVNTNCTATLSAEL